MTTAPSPQHHLYSSTLLSLAALDGGDSSSSSSSPSSAASSSYPHPVLRSSCDACTAAKVRCDKQRPECARCRSLLRPCAYSFSRKHGRSQLKRLHEILEEQEGCDVAAMAAPGLDLSLNDDLNRNLAVNKASQLWSSPHKRRRTDVEQGPTEIPSGIQSGILSCIATEATANDTIPALTHIEYDAGSALLLSDNRSDTDADADAAAVAAAGADHATAKAPDPTIRPHASLPSYALDGRHNIPASSPTAATVAAAAAAAPTHSSPLAGVQQRRLLATAIPTVAATTTSSPPSTTTNTTAAESSASDFRCGQHAGNLWIPHRHMGGDPSPVTCPPTQDCHGIALQILASMPALWQQPQMPSLDRILATTKTARQRLSRLLLCTCAAAEPMLLMLYYSIVSCLLDGIKGVVDLKSRKTCIYSNAAAAATATSGVPSSSAFYSNGIPSPPSPPSSAVSICCEQLPPSCGLLASIPAVIGDFDLDEESRDALGRQLLLSELRRIIKLVDQITLVQSDADAECREALRTAEHDHNLGVFRETETGLAQVLRNRLMSHAQRIARTIETPYPLSYS